MSANDNDEVEDSNNNTGTSVPGAASATPQFQMASDLMSKDVQPSLSPDDSEGDTLLYNNILLYRDILQLYEFNTSVHDGDISQTFKYAYIYISGFAFIFLGLGCQTMVMSFCTKHTTFGGIYHQRVTLWYSPVI